jgi:UDP-N-acetylmuramoyl-tripeptide--D-alanyl-D-alanine ligase
LSTLQKLSTHHRNQLKIPVIAITGSNGKTTTKELTASVLNQSYSILATQGNLNNHIGVPLTLLSITPEHEMAIIEMGANHPGEIAQLCEIARPDYGLITTVGKAHLEGFGSFEGVIRTKGELYDFLVKNDKQIFVNTDNPFLMEILPKDRDYLTYGTKATTTQLCGEIASNEVFLTVKALFPKGWLYLRTKLSGSYNLENVLAAARIGLHFGIDPLKIQHAIESYTPSNNRSQFQDTGRNQVLLDCYNANPTSMEVSIKNFIQMKGENKILILGDMLELGESSLPEHQNIVDLIVAENNISVLLVGTNFNLTNAPEHYLKFNDSKQLNAFLEKEKITGNLIFVKGSRGISLEKCIQWL